MKFIYPSFLWALLLIVIPIIIHLVNLRRHQTVYFSNVNFLKKVKKESQRKSKLKQLLIMLSRVMLIASLVLAFSKPYIPTGMSEKQLAQKVACIYVDNSFSMASDGPEGIALESAKQKAYSIVNASQPDTKFALLTNDFSEKLYRFYSKQEIIQLIAGIEESSNQTKLSAIILRFNDMMNHFLNETDKRIYIISDFQKNSSDLGNLKPDTITNYNFVPVTVNQTPNIYLDSCWFENPAHHVNQVEEMNVRVVNRSDEEYYNMPVNLYINDSLKALANINLAGNEKKVVTLQFTNINNGLQQGKIEINDYPIVYDNTIYFSYNVNNINNALLIKPGEVNTDTRNLEALFAKDEYIRLDIMRDDHLQISRLSNYSAIFLYQLTNISSGFSDELKKFTENGGTLVFIPSIPGNTNSYNAFLASLNASTFSNADTVKIPIGEINYDSPLYAGVFKKDGEKVMLPSIKYRYRFNEDSKVVENAILTFADKSNALTVTDAGKGKIYTFAFPFSNKENQFTDHLLFMPTLYNMVLFSSTDQQLYYVLGKDRFLFIRNPFEYINQNPVIRDRNNGKEFIPEVVEHESNMLQLSIDKDMAAGLYQIFLENKMIGGVAVNYDLKESDLSLYTPDEIKTMVGQSGIKYFNLLTSKNGNFTNSISELDSGKQRWKYFIFLALFFVLVEIAIIKFWDAVFK